MLIPLLLKNMFEKKRNFFILKSFCRTGLLVTTQQNFGKIFSIFKGSRHFLRRFFKLIIRFL